MQELDKDYRSKYFRELGFSKKTICEFLKKEKNIKGKDLWELLGVSKAYLFNLKDNPPSKLKEFVEKKIFKINWLIENNMDIPKKRSDFFVWIKKNIYETIRESKDWEEPQEGDLEFVDTKSIELNDIEFDDIDDGLFNEMIKFIHKENNYKVFSKSFIAELDSLKDECWQTISGLELILFDSNLLMLECKNPESLDDAYLDFFGSLIPPSEIIERGLAYQTILSVYAILERYYDYFNLFFTSGKKNEKKYNLFKMNMEALFKKNGVDKNQSVKNKYDKFVRINNYLWYLRNVCIHNNGDLSIKDDMVSFNETKKGLREDCDLTLKVFTVDRFKTTFTELDELYSNSKDESKDNYDFEIRNDIYNIKRCSDCESVMVLTPFDDKDFLSSKNRFVWNCSGCKKTEEASQSHISKDVLKKVEKKFGHSHYNFIYKIYIPFETYMFFIDHVKEVINFSVGLLKISANKKA
jgi:hypothetical protein